MSVLERCLYQITVHISCGAVVLEVLYEFCVCNRKVNKGFITSLFILERRCLYCIQYALCHSDDLE